MSDLEKMYWQGYDKGFDTALQQLQEIYGDVDTTDVWKDFYASNDTPETR